MSNEKIPLIKWLEMQQAGEFDAIDFDTQVKAGWYDWFCNENRLAASAAKLINTHSLIFTRSIISFSELADIVLIINVIHPKRAYLRQK